MLSSFIEEIYSWDTKALDKVLADTAGREKFHYSKNVNEEGYNLDMTLYQYDPIFVKLPRRRIPNTVTLYAFTLVCEKYPLAFPVLLKYLMHNDLLKDARKDLDNIHQTLQEMMDQDLKNLQEQLKQKDQEGRDTLVGRILKIQSYKEDIKNLFSGKTVEIKTYIKDAKIGTYAHKYYSTLESKFIEMMEKKIDAYATKDYTEIEAVYQNLNNKAKKIERLDCIINAVLITSILLTGAAYTATIAKALADENGLIFAMIIPSACILFIGLAIAGTVRSKRVDAKLSLANELEDYIVGPKQMEEVTHTKTENLMVSSDINELPKVQYARQYPDLSGMDEDHILSRQSEVQSAMEHPDLSEMNRDNSLNVFQ